MTFSYSNRLTNVKLFGLLRLLKIWRASVYKLVVKELVLFCLLYAAASLIYRLALKSAQQKKMFEKVVVYCGFFDSLLPVTFVLGFYVSVIVQRWWNQFMHIPWPDRFMSYISTLIPGSDEATVILRRTVVRYLLLCEVLLLMTVSAPIKKRFPTVESLVDEGLMTQNKMELYNSEEVPKLSAKFWMPAEWCAMLFGRARREEKIKDNFTLTVLLNELSAYKTCLYTIFFYDWISLPLVYTQVATIAVYGMFFNSVMSRQYINGTSVREQFGPELSAKYSIDIYVPVDTLVQLFFYLGWLKVAEQMMNPLGEDDDDFECNFIIDRNLKVGLFAVDRIHQMEPPLVKDRWWTSNDPQLGYTQSTRKFAKREWLGSTANLAVTTESYIQPLPDIAESVGQHSDDDAVDGDSTSFGRDPGSHKTSSAGRGSVAESQRRASRLSSDAAMGSCSSAGPGIGVRRLSSRAERTADRGTSQPGSPASSELPPAPFHFPNIGRQQQQQLTEISETAKLPGSQRQKSGVGGLGDAASTGSGSMTDKDNHKDLSAVPLIA